MRRANDVAVNRHIITQAQQAPGTFELARVESFGEYRRRLTTAAEQAHRLLVHRFAFGDIFGTLALGVQLQIHPGGGLVHHVDRLIGKLAVGDKALREVYGLPQRFVGDFNVVMLLVFLAQSAQDIPGLLEVGLLHHYRLEAPGKRSVLLEVLAVLLEGGRADAS